MKYLPHLLTAIILLTGPARSQVPNTFIPGTPARASEVNENFNVLNDAIAEIKSTQQELTSVKRLVLLDALGNQINFDGSLLIGNRGSTLEFSKRVDVNGIRVMIGVLLNSGAQFNTSGIVYYTSSDCTGMSYFATDFGPPIEGTRFTFTDPNSGEIFISKADVDPLLNNADMRSENNGVFCRALPNGNGNRPVVEVEVILNLEQLHPKPYRVETR